ncbi:MAG: bis(5'-nucleosyl)-tetraphosphatase (symmetrical) YqeK [Pseudoramibacter sp.]
MKKEKNQFEQIKAELKKVLKPHRFNHTLGVVKSASKLAKQNAIDARQAELAALLHDCAKNFSNQEMLQIAKDEKIALDPIMILEPQLLHGPVGAVVAKKKYHVKDPEVLSAVACHTTGKSDMSTLDKIIYLADFIEPGRDYPGVEHLRQTSYEKDLDTACREAFDNTISYVMSIGGLIHPKTIEARNYMIIEDKYQVNKE